MSERMTDERLAQIEAGGQPLLPRNNQVNYSSIYDFHDMEYGDLNRIIVELLQALKAERANRDAVKVLFDELLAMEMEPNPDTNIHLPWLVTRLEAAIGKQDE